MKSLYHVILADDGRELERTYFENLKSAESYSEGLLATGIGCIEVVLIENKSGRPEVLRIYCSGGR